MCPHFWKGWANNAISRIPTGPASALKDEEREPLGNVVLVLYDETSSQSIDVRPEQMAQAIAELGETLGAEANLDVVEIRVGDGEGSAIIVSDGRIDDVALFPDFPAPVHLLLTGTEAEWDRRLVIETAPAFGIIGEPVSLALRIEAFGRS